MTRKKQARIEKAQERQKEYDKLTIQEKIDRHIAFAGKDGGKKQMQKLNLQFEKNDQQRDKGGK